MLTSYHQWGQEDTVISRSLFIGHKNFCHKLKTCFYLAIIEILKSSNVVDKYVPRNTQSYKTNKVYIPWYLIFYNNKQFKVLYGKINVSVLLVRM
jgi:hypothetical protein